MNVKRNTLSKSERLCSERRIDALFGRGHRGSVGPLRFCWVADPTGEPREGEMAQGAGISVLFSVPKKVFKRAWKRNLIKRRMRESYRQRKHELLAAAQAAGRNIDIALICMPANPKTPKSAASIKEASKRIKNSAQDAINAKTAKTAATAAPEIPDFKTIDNAIAKILKQITARNRA